MTILQRPVKGSRISSFYPVKSVPVLSSLDSAFQLQEYISLLIRSNVHDVDAIVSMPGKSGAHDRAGSDGLDKDGDKDGKSDVTVDEACWVFEQLRRLAQDLSHPLITTLQQECTRATCPEMKAGEWLYLCVAHGNEGAMEQCCAIDYILHTLDSATALLNSPRAFPSRISVPATSARHFSSLARRLGRIFAHAYYHHREAFEQAEAESSLYARFLALTAKFDLVPNEFLVIPSRASAAPEDGDDEFNHGYSTRGFSEAAQRLEQERQWLTSGGIDTQIGRGISPPGPAGEARNPSPRKGRSRTDTMVHSDAVNVVEELAKGEGFSEADLNRAIAQERLLSTGDSVDEPASTAAPPASEPQPTENEEPPVPDVPEPAAAEPEAQEILSHPTEIHLDIAAPPPAEPAIPEDVEDIEVAEEADEDILTEVLEEEAPLEEPAETSEDVVSTEVIDESTTQEADVTEDTEVVPAPAEDPIEEPSAPTEPEEEAPSPAPAAESDVGVNEESQDEAETEEAPTAEPVAESATEDATHSTVEATTAPSDPEHDKPSDSDG